MFSVAKLRERSRRAIRGFGRSDVGAALVVLIERRTTTTRALKAVERAARRSAEPTTAPLAVLTRAHVRALIEDYLNGEITTGEVHAWAAAVADRMAPFQTRGPITLEAGYHYAIYAVVGNLANDRDPFIRLDVDGLARMRRLLDCEDPTGGPSEEEFRAGLTRLKDVP